MEAVIHLPGRAHRLERKELDGLWSFRARADFDNWRQGFEQQWVQVHPFLPWCAEAVSHGPQPQKAFPACELVPRHSPLSLH